MDKLEHYLDQVCRGIAGPRELRQHIRQELREHLLDAVTDNRAAGLSEEQAIAKALDDFGGPEQVRNELETLHGHRLMATVVDKAFEWKEKTMKARWLWTTCAHLTLAVMIALESFCIWWVLCFIVPAYKKNVADGLFEVEYENSRTMVAQADGCLWGVVRVATHFEYYGIFWAVALIAAWGLFEWRVRSENKSLMRLSGLGLGALAGLIYVALLAGSLIVPYVIALHANYVRAPEPIVQREVATIKAEIEELEQAVAKQDWKASERHLSTAWDALGDLASQGAAAPALLTLDEKPKIDQLRERLRIASKCLYDVQNALRSKDPERVSAALKKFQDAYHTALPPKM